MTVETRAGPNSHSSYNMYSDVEARQLMGDLLKRIFCDDPTDIDVIRWRLPIFRDETWTTLALSGNLYTSYGRSSYEPDPVKEPDYDLHIRRDLLGPLWEILAEDGVSEVFVYSPWELNVTAVSFAPDRKSLHDAIDEIPCVGTGVLFDRSATWAFFASIEESGFLGGHPAWIARFIEKSGGLGVLQSRMKYKMRAYFEMELWSPAKRRKDYEFMGWPWPLPQFPPAKGVKSKG